jgi:hypothetical protein
MAVQGRPCLSSVADPYGRLVEAVKSAAQQVAERCTRDANRAIGMRWSRALA